LYLAAGVTLSSEAAPRLTEAGAKNFTVAVPSSFHTSHSFHKQIAMASATASDLQTTSQPTPKGLNTSASTQFPTINIGTRNSALALVQANAVKQALKDANPNCTYEIKPVMVQGDKDKITPLQQLSQGENAKSLWTGELESMLEKGDLDIIVHCLKGTLGDISRRTVC
jgi:hypothetical protein